MSPDHEPKRYRVDDLIVDAGSRRVTRRGKDLAVPGLSFDLLLVLARHAPDVVSVNTLMDEVWPGLVVGPETVTKRVQLLRDALEERGDPPRYLSAVRGRGYRLHAPVQPERSGPARRPRRPTMLAATASGLLLATAALIAILYGSREADDSGPRAVVPDGLPQDFRATIVVFPFENLGPSEDDYFAAGITEELTSRLTTVHELGVISRTSAIAYDRTGKTIREIGEDLSVDYVLEGTVRWNRASEGPSRVRITPQLIRVDDDIHVWADSYDAVIEDIFQIQSDIARKTIDELQLTLPGRERRVIENPPTGNIDAYHAYLKGLYHLERRYYGAGEIPAAVPDFERAVALDPEFALAWAGLAEARSLAANSPSFDRSAANRTRAREAAGRAVELAPELPQVMLASALYYYNIEEDYPRALKWLETANQRLPGSAEVLELTGLIHRRQGRWQDAVSSHRQALALNPRSRGIAAELAVTHLFLGSYDETIRLAYRAIAVAPEDQQAWLVKAWTAVARNGDLESGREHLAAAPRTGGVANDFRPRLAWFSGDFEESIEEIADIQTPTVFYAPNFRIPTALLAGWIDESAGFAERAEGTFEASLPRAEEAVRARPQDADGHAVLGLTYASLGRMDPAIRHGERAVALCPTARDGLRGPSLVYVLAQIYARLDEPERAVDRLDELLSEPGPFSPVWFEVDRAFISLHGLGGFEAVLAKHRRNSATNAIHDSAAFERKRIATTRTGGSL